MASENLLVQLIDSLDKYLLSQYYMLASGKILVRRQMGTRFLLLA
jgi:hypothetical protein